MSQSAEEYGRQIFESNKTEFVGICDKLSELALEGRMTRLLAIYLDENGDLQIIARGAFATDCIGMLETSKAILLRRVLA